MQAKVAFLAVTAVVLGTACHHKRVTMILNCANKPCTVTANPDPVHVSGNSGTFTVTWKPANSEPWLVQFPDQSPCLGGPLIQSGRTTSCAIDIGQMNQPCYKYYAISGGAISADPGIAHDTKQAGPGCAASPAPPSSTATVARVTLFCLDLTSGSLGYCTTGAPPQPPATTNPLQNVSLSDDVYWKMNAGASITIDNGACAQGTSIPAAQGICTITTTAGNCSGTAAYCTYSYSVSGSPSQYQIQVKKR